MILCDQQIGRAVVVKISGDDCARSFELNFVEADVGSDVFESVETKIAEEFYFASAVFGLTDCNQINPAIVVVINGGNANCTFPIDDWKRNLLETFSLIISPQSNSRRR